MRVATDVGGTFTDLVCVDNRGVHTVKSDTTPPHFEQGVLNCIDKSGLNTEEFSYFAHGTTVVINALLSRKGSKTALITTRGFRDVLEIARGNRPDLFNLAFNKPAPFVPRYLRHEVTERLNYSGEVTTPIELSELDSVVKHLRKEGVEAVAICLLHGYVNPVHEQQAKARILELWPEAAVIASHEVCREWREYERTSTTVLSAYVLPNTRRYLSDLEDQLHKKGLKPSPFIMQSNGGVATVKGTLSDPITLVESGPASGMLGAASIGNIIGEKNLIALDIGGTTAKCALIHDGKARITTEYRIEWNRENPGYPIRTPVVDLVEIGNGGGSIAWIDEGGSMHVGPQSAGSAPGPAAYGRGGDRATTTDANLLLGRINPDLFLGGEHKPDWDSLNAAFGKLSDSLGGSNEDVARGVIRIANANMVNALKLVSLNRGYDPRDFSLIAFGGGGAMHAVSLAEELKVKKVIIPVNASVFSAWGMLMSDLRRDFLQTRVENLAQVDSAIINKKYDDITTEAQEKCENEGMTREQMYVERFADMRYLGQEHTIKVDIPDGAIDAASIDQAIQNFHQAHQREYSFELQNPVELVNYHVVVFGKIEKQPLAQKSTTGAAVTEALKGTRRVDYDDHGIHDADIYDLSLLEPGMTFEGPAIVEDATNTLVITPNKKVRMDNYGNIHIEMED